MDFLEIYALGRANEAHRAARLASFQAKRRQLAANDRIEDLERQVGELSLVVRSLFRMFVEKGVVDRAEFRKVVDAVDASDGTVDGRYDGRPQAP